MKTIYARLFNWTEWLHHMAHQACLIIRSKSHEANVPYTEGKMRRNDGRSFPNSFMCCEETLQVVILTKHQGPSVLSRVFLQWYDCFQPVCLPAQQFLKLLEEVCSYGTRPSRYLLLFLLYAISDIYTWVPDTWSGTRQVTVNIGWLEAFHVLFLWLLMNVFQFFVPWKGTALLIAPSMYNSHCTRMVGVDQLHFLTNWILEPTPVLSWRSSFLFHLRNGFVRTFTTAAYVVNCYKFYLNHRCTIHILQAFFSVKSVRLRSQYQDCLYV